MQQTYNTSRPYATLMKGRPDEPDSHQHVAVYSKEECQQFRQKGWLSCMEFLERVDRARRKDL